MPGAIGDLAKLRRLMPISRTPRPDLCHSNTWRFHNLAWIGLMPAQLVTSIGDVQLMGISRPVLSGLQLRPGVGLLINGRRKVGGCGKRVTDKPETPAVHYPRNAEAASLQRVVTISEADLTERTSPTPNPANKGRISGSRRAMPSRKAGSTMSSWRLSSSSLPYHFRTISLVSTRAAMPLGQGSPPKAKLSRSKRSVRTVWSPVPSTTFCR